MKFFKYQGTGNDFVMIDQTQSKVIGRRDIETVAALCHRRFGIGADGVILLERHPDFDFEMVYFNSDGSQSFCGNGGRCAVAFAHQLGIISGNSCRFLAIDGEHEALFFPGEKNKGLQIELKMTNVRDIEHLGDTYILSTGSPHFVRFVHDLADFDIVGEGKAVRYSERFREHGINVNLACRFGPGIRMETYERGVEDETLSCGTGVTAAAIAHHLHERKQTGRHEVPVKTKGGDLSVRFFANEDGTFSDVWLCGPAAFVFQGQIEI